MSSERREEKLNSLLSQCEQLYNRLRQIVPDSGETDASAIPHDRKRLATTAIHFLLRNLEEADKLFKQATLDGAPQGVAPRPLEFYRNTLVPNRESLETLFIDLLDLPDVDIDFKQLRPETRSAPVWNILVSGLDFWDQDETGAFSPDDLEAADHLLYSPFFEPDQWLCNAAELEPILGELAERRIPSNVRVRLKELYRSFTLGNYLSVVALARAILEYALVDRSARLGIDPSSHDPRHPTRTRRLRELVDDASEKVPDLKLAMECILDAGNQTLHPKKKDKLVLLRSALRSLALTSVQSIRAVVEKLYL